MVTDGQIKEIIERLHEIELGQEKILGTIQLSLSQIASIESKVVEHWSELTHGDSARIPKLENRITSLEKTIWRASGLTIATVFILRAFLKI